MVIAWNHCYASIKWLRISCYIFHWATVLFSILLFLFQVDLDVKHQPWLVDIPVSLNRSCFYYQSSLSAFLLLDSVLHFVVIFWGPMRTSAVNQNFEEDQLMSVVWERDFLKVKTGANWSFIVLYNLDKLQKKMAGKVFPQKWYLCNLLGWLSLQRRYKYLQMWACLSLQMHNGVDGNKRNLSNMSTQLQTKKWNPKWWKSPSPFQYRSVNKAF